MLTPATLQKLKLKTKNLHSHKDFCKALSLFEPLATIKKLNANQDN